MNTSAVATTTDEFEVVDVLHHYHHHHPHNRQEESDDVESQFDPGTTTLVSADVYYDHHPTLEEDLPSETIGTTPGTCTGTSTTTTTTDPCPTNHNIINKHSNNAVANAVNRRDSSRDGVSGHHHHDRSMDEWNAPPDELNEHIQQQQHDSNRPMASDSPLQEFECVLVMEDGHLVEGDRDGAIIGDGSQHNMSNNNSANNSNSSKRKQTAEHIQGITHVVVDEYYHSHHTRNYQHDNDNDNNDNDRLHPGDGTISELSFDQYGHGIGSTSEEDLKNGPSAVRYSYPYDEHPPTETPFVPLPNDQSTMIGVMGLSQVENMDHMEGSQRRHDGRDVPNTGLRDLVNGGNINDNDNDVVLHPYNGLPVISHISLTDDEDEFLQFDIPPPPPPPLPQSSNDREKLEISYWNDDGLFGRRRRRRYNRSRVRKGDSSSPQSKTTDQQNDLWKRRKRILCLLVCSFIMLIASMTVLIVYYQKVKTNPSSTSSIDSNAVSVEDGTGTDQDGTDETLDETIGSLSPSASPSFVNTTTNQSQTSSPSDSIPNADGQLSQSPTSLVETSSPSVSSTNESPTFLPTTLQPSFRPSSAPSLEPTTLSPSETPTVTSSLSPSGLPSISPSIALTETSSEEPSIIPTSEPSQAMTVNTAQPSETPSMFNLTSMTTSSPSENNNCITFVESDRGCYSGGNSAVRISFQNCDPREQDWVGVYLSSQVQSNDAIPEPNVWRFSCGTRTCTAITPDADLTFQSSNFFRRGRSYVAVLAREGDNPPYTAIARSATFRIDNNC